MLLNIDQPSIDVFIDRLPNKLNDLLHIPSQSFLLHVALDLERLAIVDHTWSNTFDLIGVLEGIDWRTILVCACA